MLKLARRAKGHFMTLIEIRVHLIRCKPGHISPGWDHIIYTVSGKKRAIRIVAIMRHVSKWHSVIPAFLC